MTDYATAINRQYGHAGLSLKILDALQRAGKNLDALTRDDLVMFDELHIGGRGATRALATLAGLQPGMYVLDIGSGVGGPSRTLAAEFGCRVLGLDLTEEFCRAAEMMTTRVGLGGRVTFKQGDALDMPFDSETFDVVWTQSTVMNIADKGLLLQEVRRVLRPEGLLALEANLEGSVPGLHFPVFWADDPTVSFLCTPEELRQLSVTSGFTELRWEDVTAQVIDRSRNQQAGTELDPSPLGIHLIHADAALKAANVMRNMKEGRIAVIQAVYERSL